MVGLGAIVLFEFFFSVLVCFVSMLVGTWVVLTNTIHRYAG